jgi:fermentation-respiration switch protein FrsA (DUF1100 family)
MKRSITFDRDGLTLVGDLFAPEGFDEAGRYPAVIVEGSFTSVLPPDPVGASPRSRAERPGRGARDA